MSTLSTIVDPYIKPKICCRSHGDKFFRLLDENNNFRIGPTENTRIINILRGVFDCWELTRTPSFSHDPLLVDYIFIIKTKTGRYLGACQLPKDIQKTDYVIIHYEYVLEDEIHLYNQTYNDNHGCKTIKYIKI
jgi:hypothetical protein